MINNIVNLDALSGNQQQPGINLADEHTGLTNTFEETLPQVQQPITHTPAQPANTATIANAVAGHIAQSGQLSQVMEGKISSLAQQPLNSSAQVNHHLSSLANQVMSTEQSLSQSVDAKLAGLNQVPNLQPPLASLQPVASLQPANTKQLSALNTTPAVTNGLNPNLASTVSTSVSSVSSVSTLPASAAQHSHFNDTMMQAHTAAMTARTDAVNQDIDTISQIITQLSSAQKSTAQASQWGPVTVTQTAPVLHQANELAAPIRDQLRFQIDQQIKTAEMRLDPPELGRVELSIRLDGDRLHVQMHAANPAVRDALMMGLERLKMELAMDHGGQIDVDIGQSESHQQQPRQSAAIANGEDVEQASATNELTHSLDTDNKQIDLRA